MRSIRLIGRLDIKGENLIKSINLEGLRIVGNPNKFAKKYYKEGINEIIMMDTVASLYGRNHLSKIILSATKEIFVPITVGGGIRSLEDALSILNCGADKITINTAAVNNPRIISEIVNHIGSQSIMVSIEAKKRTSSKWEVYTSNGRDRTGIDVIKWVKEIENLGAGEILLTSIDQEGTRKGFDIDLAKAVLNITDIPVIISGGYGEKIHITKLKSSCELDAVAIADGLHYNRISIDELQNLLK